MTAALELRGVRFGFSGRPLFDALDFRLQAGEIIGLIGPPESGKSVLLKLISGLLDPQQGDVFVQGTKLGPLSEAQRYAERRHIGMVFQNNALFDSLTVYDNVAFPLRALGRFGQAPDAATIDARVRARLDEVGLSHALQSYPHELSGGMKKRAGIARATITQPRFCFYDEPTAGLDPVTSAKIYALIRGFTERDGAGALVISNELDTLLPVCNRVVMLFDGKIVYSGAPDGLPQAAHPAVRQFATGASEGPL